MTCNEAQRRIPRAADGSGMDADFWRHLDTCDSCSGMLEEHATVSYMLTTCAPRPAPSGFASGVRGRIEARASFLEWTDWKAWTLRLAPLAGGLALAAALWMAPTPRWSLWHLMDEWTGVRGRAPVTALFWHDAPDDVLLQAVLDGRSEAAMRHYYAQEDADERGRTRNSHDQ
jgi:hypothetical protein